MSASLAVSLKAKACFNSVWFGVITSTKASNSADKTCAGAGFNTNVAPCCLANCAACNTQSIGISNWHNTTSAAANKSACASMSAKLKAKLAPETTMMWLSPSATVMLAMPVLMPVFTAMPLQSTPSCCKIFKAASPLASSPTAPIIATCAPKRAAATAWFEPLPPKAVVKVCPNKVSPTLGKRSNTVIKSILMLPTTKILLLINLLSFSKA